MNWQSRNPDDASVYVLERGGLVKVGSSWEPDERIRRGPFKGRLAYQTPYMRGGRIIERMTHAMLRQKGVAVAKEWFATSVETAVKTIEAAINCIDDPPPVAMPPTTVVISVDPDIRAALRDYTEQDPHNLSTRIVVSLAVRRYLEAEGFLLPGETGFQRRERTISRRERDKRKEGK